MISDQVLLSATTTGTSTAYDFLSTARNVTFYITGVGTIAAGTLQLETADDPNYSGTWAPLDTAYNLTNVTGGKQAIKQYTGPYRAVRARIGTDVSGTTPAVTVRVIGN